MFCPIMQFRCISTSRLLTQQVCANTFLKFCIYLSGIWKPYNNKKAFKRFIKALKIINVFCPWGICSNKYSFMGETVNFFGVQNCAKGLNIYIILAYQCAQFCFKYTNCWPFISATIWLSSTLVIFLLP